MAIEVTTPTPTVPSISFRTQARAQSCKRKVELLEEDCLKAFNRACTSEITSSIERCLKTPIKRAKNSTTEDPETIKTSLKDSLIERTSVPRGLLRQTTAIVREVSGINNLTSEQVQPRLGTKSENISKWRKHVEAHFEELWDRRGVALNKGPQQPDDYLDDKEDPATDEQDQSKDLRTASATLKGVLAPQMSQYAGEFVQIAQSRQSELTGVVREVSALVHKTILLIAGGELNSPVFDTSTVTKFDLMTALPSGFQPRTNVDQVLRIAPLPPGLQERLVESIKSKSKKDDLSTLLSQGHLQYLYSHFMGTLRGKGNVSERHPIWDLLTHPIQSKSDTESIPEPPRGLTMTINTCLRELAVNIDVMWSGSIYDKLLDYLLRVLLRLHLAPLREQRYWDNRQAAANKKRDNTSPTPKKARKIRKDRKAKIKRLCDELANASSPQHVSSICHQLSVVTTQEIRDTSSLWEGTPDEEYGPFDDESDDESDDDDALGGVGAVAPVNQQDPQGVKEPSRSRLRKLQGVLKMLLQSPAISQHVDRNWVKKSGPKENDFTFEECNVLAFLANLLGPYVPKLKLTEDGKTEDSLAHVALRAPLVVMANAILRLTGYGQFCRKICPQISAGVLHALPLSAPNIYEMFCSKWPNQFDVVDLQGNPITSVASITATPSNKDVMFSAFFNMDAIQGICQAHNIKFANRITFVDPLTIRILGEVIPHGPHRNGYPVTSEFENKRKDKKKRRGRDWKQEFQGLGISIVEAESNLETVSRQATENEKIVKTLRHDLSLLERDLSQVNKAHSDAEKLSKSTSQGMSLKDYPTYSQVKDARAPVQELRSKLIPAEADLKDSRRARYFWEKVCTAARKEGTISTRNNEGVKMTRPSGDRPVAEDNVETIDLSGLANRRMTYSGTDYGLKKMSVTVPMSHNAIITHLNRFHALGTLDPDDPPPKLEELRIPDPIIITAPQVNSISYATKASRNRERRLKQDRNSEVRTSLEELGNLQVPLRHATTMESIDEALATTRRVSETIQSFESSPANVKDGHTRALRTKRAWSKIAAHERSIIKNHEQVTSPPPTDPRSRNVIPIMLTGTAGTCIGSRIKGSAKRGGGKLREEHRKHAIVERDWPKQHGPSTAAQRPDD
ncbi:hypothetical protein BGX31_004728 [Mortierella sp. GBA43]|nr:hypothetical protein BGX31_004728 [Mortierella sp. GBA43]